MSFKKIQYILTLFLVCMQGIVFPGVALAQVPSPVILGQCQQNCAVTPTIFGDQATPVPVANAGQAAGAPPCHQASIHKAYIDNVTQHSRIIPNHENQSFIQLIMQFFQLLLQLLQQILGGGGGNMTTQPQQGLGNPQAQVGGGNGNPTQGVAQQNQGAGGQQANNGGNQPAQPTVDQAQMGGGAQVPCPPTQAPQPQAGGGIAQGGNNPPAANGGGAAPTSAQNPPAGGNNGATPAQNGKNFTVTATGGFKDPAGNSWPARGVDFTPQDLIADWTNVLAKLPGITFIRLVCDSDYLQAGNNQANQDLAIQMATAAGIVVEFEDHSDAHSSGTGTPNTQWYLQMVAKNKNNPLVFLELPNEPTAGTLVQDQIDLINAVRAAGWTNPIGLMSWGGFQPGNNWPGVLASVGTTQIYGALHLYNYDAASVNSNISDAVTTYGIFPVIDEFGGATDGFTQDPNGDVEIQAVIAAQTANQAGAVYWVSNNGDQPDSVFSDSSGNTFAREGSLFIQPWLSGTRPVIGGL